MIMSYTGGPKNDGICVWGSFLGINLLIKKLKKASIKIKLLSYPF